MQLDNKLEATEVDEAILGDLEVTPETTGETEVSTETPTIDTPEEPSIESLILEDEKKEAIAKAKAQEEELEQKKVQEAEVQLQIQKEAEALLKRRDELKIGEKDANTLEQTLKSIDNLKNKHLRETKTLEKEQNDFSFYNKVKIKYSLSDGQVLTIKNQLKNVERKTDNIALIQTVINSVVTQGAIVNTEDKEVMSSKKQGKSSPSSELDFVLDNSEHDKLLKEARKRKGIR